MADQTRTLNRIALVFLLLAQVLIIWSEHKKFVVLHHAIEILEHKP